jgi:ABC-type molybdenum transport system ATPase subunit/photorepair protein PhrA
VGPGVGAARGVDLGLLTRQLLDRPAQLALDGPVAGLELPARKAGAVVLDEEADIGRGGDACVALRA